jgi:tetratricopeptide (TPR) repeat protein/predicted aspartyl protease
MLARYAAWIAFLLVLPNAAIAADGCTLVRTPDIQVTMDGLTPLVSVKINGTDERLILDSGAAYSTLSIQTAERLNLPHYADTNFYMEGATGGRAATQVAAVDSFTIANLQVQHVDFVVVPVVWSGGTAGLLGQNVLRFGDVEYDLSDGVARLIRPLNCGDRPLAYWATSQPVSVVDLRAASALHPHMIGSVLLNGRAIRALFDTGGQHSIISLHAAKMAGITPQSPGVTAAGTISGIGGRPVRVWSASFASIDIGGEKILRTRALIGDIEDGEADMILGADFFLAHRVYVDNSRNKLYFTYDGGPVFNLNTPPAGSPRTPAGSAATAASPTTARSPATAALPATDVPTNQPADGAGFMRRGMAYAARHEVANALADFSRACQLSPRDPQVFYERALLYQQNGQPAAALQDLDRALALDPHDLDALAARAALRLPNRSVVEQDLAAIDHLAPPDSDIRLSAAYDYGEIGEYAAAVHQYDVWIDSRRQDKSVGFVSPDAWALALSNRCQAQGAAGLDLDRALSDCDKALDLLPKSSNAFNNRALVHLQRGELQSAIADYDTSLKLQPRGAEALYGRGLAEMHSGQPAAARADIAAAVAIKPGVAQRFASFGLKP